MSKKIDLFIPGKKRPNLISVFSKYINRKLGEDDKKLEKYCEMFPFLAQWAVSLEEAELILQYYGYLDIDGNLIGKTKKKNYYSDLDIEDEYWTEYEELHPTDEDDEDDIPPDVVYPDDYWAELEEDYKNKYNEGRKGKHKHRKHRSKKKTELIDINTPYSGFEENPDELGSVAQHIYYYPDYTDKTDKLEFNSLKDFDDFCLHNGFCVPPYIAERIAYRPVSHCCLNPLSKSRGIEEIMAEESYADMMFEASEILELAK